MKLPVHASIVLVLFVGAACFAQGAAPVPADKPASANAESILTLAAVSTVTVHSEPTSMFTDPMRCDGDGNLYLRPFRAELGLAAPVKKFDSNGKLVATFAVDSVPNLKVLAIPYFAVTASGEVYELIAADKDPYMHVAVFGKDGSYKSNIKLDALVHGSQLAVFPSGELLLSGIEQTESSPRPPFVGIFKDDGTLTKRLSLEDDKRIQAAVERGDFSVSDPTRPGSNLAVSLGQAAAGEDGNIYVMRRTTPAVLYGISPAGAVVRRVEVGSPDPEMMPTTLHASANRLLVMFRNENTKEQLLKVIDMGSGDLTAQYRTNSLGAALACYLANDNRFVFMTNTKDRKMAFNIAEAR